MSTIPIIIIARDRVTCLKNLITWLESIGEEHIHIVDNESSYPPMLEYLQETPHMVYNIENHGPSSPWRIPQLKNIIANNFFIVTDPDVYPSEDCPDDIIARARHVLDRLKTLDKIGPCLQIDDIPENNPRRNAIQKWESPSWNIYNHEYDYYLGAIDTTFAVHRPGTPYKLTESVRMGKPYMFKHLTWYLDFDNLNEEDQYYSDHAGWSISTWGRQELPSHYQELL